MSNPLYVLVRGRRPKCDMCDQPASSMVGEQNHILVCDLHAEDFDEEVEQ